MSSSGAITLGEIADRLPMLEVACSRCERHGRLRVARLIERYGENAAHPPRNPGRRLSEGRRDGQQARRQRQTQRSQPYRARDASPTDLSSSAISPGLFGRPAELTCRCVNENQNQSAILRTRSSRLKGVNSPEVER
jgi:hypothetical protein